MGGHPEVKNEDKTVRKHLANVHPGVMAKLLNASVYKLYWIHDYQAVCFPYEEGRDAATSVSVASPHKILFLPQ